MPQSAGSGEAPPAALRMTAASRRALDPLEEIHRIRCTSPDNKMINGVKCYQFQCMT